MALGSPGNDLNNKQTTAHRLQTVGQPGAFVKCICGGEMCVWGTYPTRSFRPHIYISGSGWSGLQNRDFSSPRTADFASISAPGVVIMRGRPVGTAEMGEARLGLATV